MKKETVILILAYAAQLIGVGVWVGEIDSKVKQIRAEVTDIWSKYNKLLEEKEDKSITIAKRLSKQDLEIELLKKDIEQLKQRKK